jgi:hypothetical protein
MSYRKITVDNIEYQYVVGKTHVKIKGIGAWPKDQVGHVHDERLTVVEPHHIAQKIKEHI